MTKSSGLRQHHRFEMSSDIYLSWSDSQGVTLQCKGKGVDISERGLGVLVNEVIPERTYVNFRVKDIDFTGIGSVRSVKRKGLQLLMGIEYTGATQVQQSLFDRNSASK